MPVPGPRLRGSPQANRPSSEQPRGHGRPTQTIRPSVSAMNGPGSGQFGRASQGLGHNGSYSGALLANIYENRQSSAEPDEPTAGASTRLGQAALYPSLDNPFTTRFLQATAQMHPPSSAYANPPFTSSSGTGTGTATHDNHPSNLHHHAHPPPTTGHHTLQPTTPPLLPLHPAYQAITPPTWPSTLLATPTEPKGLEDLG